MDKIESLIWALSAFLLAREIFQLRDKTEPNKGYSKAWHAMGWFMRLLVVGLIFQATFNWLLTTLMIIILWPVYNISCNIGLKRKWYYVSNSGIDWVIRKIFFFINFDK
jgi:fatty-acid desaturase